MKKWKRLLSGILAVATAISLGACMQDTDKKKNGNGKDEVIAVSKGRYMESAVNAPEGLQMAMELLADGTLRSVTTKGIFDSKDKGKSWSTWDKLTPELQQDFATAVDQEYGFEYNKIKNAAISRDGSIFYIVSETEKVSYKLVAPDGSMREVPLELEEKPKESKQVTAVSGGGWDTSIISAVFTDNGDLLCADFENIYQIDTQSLALKHQYKPMDAAGESNGNVMEGGAEDAPYNGSGFEYDTIGNKLYVMAADYKQQEDGSTGLADIQTTVYALDTFQPEGEQKVLEEFLMSREGGNGVYNKILMRGADGSSLYFVNPTGIYRYLTEGTTVEKIFQGTLGRMSAPDSILLNGIVIDDKNFMMNYNASDGSESSELLCYTYDPDVPSAPEKTLTVYSLYDNRSIRQMMFAYQSKNPNVLVELEVGIEAGEGITRTDALKNLNTNIMAGDGPDILVLDGMPLDSYMEKGLLLDISDVIKETEKKDPLFENIVNTYKKGDACLAVPLRFSVPVMFGKQELLKADNLQMLADTIEQMRTQHPDGDSVIGKFSPSLLLNTLMPASSPSWVKDDGTLDKEILEQFITDIKRIADAQQCEGIEGKLPEGEWDLSPFMSSTEYAVIQMGFAGASMSFGHAKTNQDLWALYSMLEHLGDGSYKPMPGQSEHTFIPINPIGINAKGSESEIAKDFLGFLLQDAQFHQSGGWPVNKSAFDELKKKPEGQQDGRIKMPNDDGSGTFEMNYVWPSEQKFDEFKKMIGELTTPAVTDDMIIRTVFEETNKCLSGEASVSDTTDTILQKVNLYLGE